MKRNLCINGILFNLCHCILYIVKKNTIGNIDVINQTYHLHRRNTPLSVYWHEEFSNGSSVLLWEGDYISRLDPYNFKYQDRTYNISVTKGDNYKCTVKSYHLEFMVDKRNIITLP
jgi:hypothetical protein